MSDAVTMAVPVVPAGEAVAIPPRYWWLKRIGAAVGVLLVLLGAMRGYWGWEADRRLQAEIDRIRAAGEPIFPEDFDPPEPVPDEDNAALAIQNATTAMNVGQTEFLLISDVMRFPNLVVEHQEELAKLMRANAEALQLLREARFKSGVDWGTRIRRPAINFVVPSLQGVRALVKLARVAAIYEHHRNHDFNAIEILGDAFHCSKMVDRNNGFLIAYLTAIPCRALIAQTVEDIVPTLQVTSSGDPARGVTSAAGLASVRSLIDELTDSRPLAHGWRLAIYGERMYQLDAMLALIEGDLSYGALFGPRPASPSRPLGAIVTFTIAPILKLDALSMIQNTARQAVVSTQPNLVAARRVFPAITKEHHGVARVTRLLSVILQRSFERTLEFHYQTVALCRMAGAALAIRLFELDHGRRPATLSELVPEYLEAVPLDPLAGDSSEIGYLPNAPKPILYSVGLDSADDQGDYKLNPNGSVERQSKDVAFFLNGDRPRSEPPDELIALPKQTDEEGGDVEDDAGEDDEHGGGGEEPE